MLFPIFHFESPLNIVLVVGALLIPYLICKVRKIRSSIAYGTGFIVLGIECIIAQAVSYHSSYGYIEGSGATAVGIGYIILGVLFLLIKTKRPNQKVEPTVKTPVE